MGGCLSKFNDKSFTFRTPPLISGRLKRWKVVYKRTLQSTFPWAYIKNMGRKGLLKLLKIALWMYMVDFLHNLLSY